MSNMTENKRSYTALNALSFRLFLITVSLIAVGLIGLATQFTNLQVVSQVTLAVGASMLASLVVQSVYSQIAEKYALKKVSEEVTDAAVSHAKKILYDNFIHVIPKRTYPRSSRPSNLYRLDFVGYLSSSKIYRHKGDSGSFASFRLTKLANHPEIARKDDIVFCLLDPRVPKLMRNQALLDLKAKDSLSAEAISRSLIDQKAKEIANRIYITLSAFFDISHILKIKVCLHTEKLFFRSEVFDDALFVSYYLGGDFPGSYLYTKDTYIYEAFAMNFKQAIEDPSYEIRFNNNMTEDYFLSCLGDLGYEGDLAQLREQRVALYNNYEESLPFEPDQLF